MPPKSHGLRPSVGRARQRNASKVYACGLDLISQRDVTTSDTRYFGYDGLGSTRMVTTTNATVLNAFSYDAFVTLIASNAAPQADYLFAGEQRDANLGFYYLRARHLNPGTGRFWNRDSHPGNLYTTKVRPCAWRGRSRRVRPLG